MALPSLPSKHHPQYAHIIGHTLEGVKIDTIEWIEQIRWTFDDHEFDYQPKPEFLRSVEFRTTEGETITLDGTKPVVYSVLDSGDIDVPEDIDRVFTADLEAAFRLENSLSRGDDTEVRAAAAAALNALHRMYHAALYGVRAAREIVEDDTDIYTDPQIEGSRASAEQILDALRAGLEGKEPTR